MKKRKTLFFSIVLTGSQLFGFGNDSDTLFISPVIISKARINFYTEDNKSISIDSIELARNSSVNLGELLLQNSTLNVTSYGGSSSVSSISFRGTGSNHTRITWMGFPVNSLTTSGADLSLIPVGFYDNISLVYGTSGSLHGSSSIGGSINLENRTDWTNRVNGSLSAEMGSFGYQRYGVAIGVGNKLIQYRITGFYNRSKDDFWYIDQDKSGNPKQRLDHNRNLSFGILQDLSLKFSDNNTVELGLWYLNKKKEIPEILGSYGTSNQMQKDSTLKGYIKWNKRSARTNLILKSAYFMDYLRYTDKLDPSDENYIVDSKIKSHSILNDVNFRWYLNNSVSFDIGGTYSYLTAQTENYASNPKESEGEIFGGVKAKLGLLVSNVTIRKVFTPYKDPDLLYSAGIKITSRSNRISTRLNLSNKFRTPGFNEKYWQPGGNPDLLPEKGWGMNLGTEWFVWKSQNETGQLCIDADLYSMKISNWIQWTPTEVNNIWSPLNYKEVWSRGIESSLNISNTWGNLTGMFKTGYSFTRSTATDMYGNAGNIGAQLKYVPLHSANGTLSVTYKRYYLSLYNKFSGKRFTTEENDPTEHMAPFIVSNLLAGIMAGKNKEIVIQLRITNLFNINYQVIRSYPMPGRGFYVTISANFSQKSGEHSLALKNTRLSKRNEKQNPGKKPVKNQSIHSHY